jgi:uncharacterized protein (TIGR03437 family)
MEYPLRLSPIGITIFSCLLAFSAQAQTPTFTASSVVNDASMASGPIAPGMVANITGQNLGSATLPGNCTTTPLPYTCSAVSVLVNGSAAPLLYDSAALLKFQVPFTLTGSSATIQVTSTLSGSKQSSAAVTVPVAPAAPALYTASTSGSGTAYYYDSNGVFGSYYSIPVNPGDTVTLFGTGFGVTSPAVASGTIGPNTPAAVSATVVLTIGGQTVPATAVLMPGSAPNAQIGWDQVTFTVPSGLNQPTNQASSTYAMIVTVGGVASPSVNLLVAPPFLSLTAVSPSPVPLSTAPVTVTFTGSGFESGLTLTLQSPSGVQTNITGSNLNILSSTQFTAQITTGTTPGTWNAIVAYPNGDDSNFVTFLASGTGPTPTITKVEPAWSSTAESSQNTWIEIHGANLSSVTDTWSNASFANGLPTKLDGVTVTVDGLPAAIYYVSPTQINALAPLDTATGSVAVVVNTPYGPTAAQTVTETPATPAFLYFDAAGHINAQHLNYTLIGPTSLGSAFTPATPGEIVILYTTGFGQTTPAFSSQLTAPLNSSDEYTVSYAVTPLPTVTIGNLPATVGFAGLISPGLYQLNVTVPTSAPAGDLPIVAMYNGASTQSNAVITVQ